MSTALPNASTTFRDACGRRIRRISHDRKLNRVQAPPLALRVSPALSGSVGIGTALRRVRPPDVDQELGEREGRDA
jgi:hypothetical protein